MLNTSSKFSTAISKLAPSPYDADSESECGFGPIPRAKVAPYAPVRKLPAQFQPLYDMIPLTPGEQDIFDGINAIIPKHLDTSPKGSRYLVVSDGWTCRTRVGALPSVSVQTNDTTITFKIGLDENVIVNVYVPLSNRDCTPVAVKAAIQKAYLLSLKGTPKLVMARPGMITVQLAADSFRAHFQSPIQSDIPDVEEKTMAWLEDLRQAPTFDAYISPVVEDRTHITWSYPVGSAPYTAASPALNAATLCATTTPYDSATESIVTDLSSPRSQSSTVQRKPQSYYEHLSSTQAVCLLLVRLAFHSMGKQSYGSMESFSLVMYATWRLAYCFNRQPVDLRFAFNDWDEWCLGHFVDRMSSRNLPTWSARWIRVQLEKYLVITTMLLVLNWFAVLVGVQAWAQATFRPYFYQ